MTLVWRDSGWRWGLLGSGKGEPEGLDEVESSAREIAPDWQSSLSLELSLLVGAKGLGITGGNFGLAKIWGLLFIEVCRATEGGAVGLDGSELLSVSVDND